jgi:hypothetical protein
MDKIPEQPRIAFSRRTIKWLYITSITAASSIVTMLVTGWSIESAELFVVSLGTLFVVWLSVTIWQSRGRFRIVSMLILCTVVAFFLATILPKTQSVRAHKRLTTEVLGAGGTVRIVGKSRRANSEGWAVTREGYAFPKMLAPLYELIDGGEVGELEIPIDLVRDDMLRDVRFSEYCSVVFLMRGDARDVRAIDNLVRNAKQQYVSVRTENLRQRDAEVLKNAKKPVIIHFVPEYQQGQPPVLRLSDIQRAASVSLMVIIHGSFELEKIESPKITLESPGPLTISLESGGSYDSTLFDALAGRKSPLKLSMYQSTLTPGAWASLANLQCIEDLRLIECGPTESQLKQLAGLRNLTDLSLCDSKTSETSIQELFKIGTLQSAQITKLTQVETVRCLINNNPNLRFFEVQRGFEGLFNSARFRAIYRLPIEDLKSALKEHESMIAQQRNQNP